jgi:hypothetical protein
MRKSVSSLNFPSSEGSVPFKAFPCNHSSSISTRVPSSEGTPPVNRFRENRSCAVKPENIGIEQRALKSEKQMSFAWITRT